jgi:uncharacterized protein YfiM (DUF2279 family)
MIKILKKISLVFCCCLASCASLCQTNNDTFVVLSTMQLNVTPQPATTLPLNKQKLLLVTGAHAAVWAGSYVALNKAWYAGYPKQTFHTFNDFGEWNQLDKAGHVWTAYTLAGYSTELWKWTGISSKTNTIIGGASAIAYQSIIEIQDGYSTQWGFSWGDMAANLTGAGAYVAQQLAWKQQRLQIKFSYHPYNYHAAFTQRRNDLFGKGPLERILKDYNSQTYWLSGNLHSFFKNRALPKWLNIAVGYSSNVMLGGEKNTWIDKNGNLQNYTGVPRTRRFYIAPDVDLTKIKTNSKFLRGIFFTLNAVKFPAPALALCKGRLKLHAVAF